MASVDNLKYQCPACLKQLFPPVFQCTIGHLVCKNCIIKFDKCPTCKIPIVSDPQHGKIRNREVEKIIRDYQTHECPSPKCAKRMKLEDLAEHRPKCIHKTGKYCSFLKLSTCEEKVPLSELANHLETKHHGVVNQFVQKLPGSVMFKVTLPRKRDNPHMFMCWMQGQTTDALSDFSAGDDTFLFILMVSSRSGSIFWTPFIVGNDALTNRLKSDISVFPNIKSPRASLRCSWSPIYSPANKMWNVRQSFSATREQFRGMALLLANTATSENVNDEVDALLSDDPFGEESDGDVEVDQEINRSSESEDGDDDCEDDSLLGIHCVEIRLRDIGKNREYNFRARTSHAGGKEIEGHSPQNQARAKQISK